MRSRLLHSELRHLLKRWIAVGILILYSGAFMQNLSVGDEKGGILIQILFSSTYVFCFILVLKRPIQSLDIIKKDKINLTLILIAFVSTLWSVNAADSLSKAIALIGTTFVALFLVSRFNRVEFLLILRNCFLLVLFFSLLYVIFLPQYGLDVHPHLGAWKGVFYQKNIFARILVTSIIIFYTLFSITHKRAKKNLYVLLILLCIFCIIMSGSSTSLIVVGLIFIILPVLKYWERKKPSKKVVFLFVSSFILVLAGGLFYLKEFIFEMLGKDLTFSGRTILWYLSLEKIMESPLLGYGYNVFWENNTGPSMAIFYKLGWSPNHAHNGLIELALSCGLFSVFLFVINFWKNIKRSLRYLMSSQKKHGIYFLAFLIIFTIFNITQTHILVKNSLFWVLYLYISFSNTIIQDTDEEIYYSNIQR